MHQWALERMGDQWLPVILMGDLNCRPDSPPMRHFFSQQVWSAVTADAAGSLEGVPGTFGTFDSPTPYTPPKIDYILVNRKAAVVNGKTLIQVTEGKHPSDHHPVTAELQW